MADFVQCPLCGVWMMSMMPNGHCGGIWCASWRENPKRARDLAREREEAALDAAFRARMGRSE